jgi:hypothetical protein
MDRQEEGHSRESGNPECGVGFLDARLRRHDENLFLKIKLTKY